MHHLKGWKVTGRDRSRRLGYQERQRLQQQAEKDSKIALKHGWYSGIELTKEQLTVFVKKLVK